MTKPPRVNLPQRSPVLCRFMTGRFTSYLRRYLNALRVAEWGGLQVVAGRPVVIYSNHPSWWDAITYNVLARRLLPDRASFAPIDAAMLKKYRFFERIGAFGIDLGSRRGAIDFLRTASVILQDPANALWITAQGSFKDVRDRPVGLRPGVAHLPEHVGEVDFIPLAIEYAFWSERGAEALVAFGQTMRGSDLAALSRPMRLAALENELSLTMDRLAGDARSRDHTRFVALVEGRQGIGGIYDGWRGLRARFSGEAFEPGHLEHRS